MKAARKTAKAKSKAKSSTLKAKKATTSAARGKTKAAASRGGRDVGTRIKNLDVTSLHDDDIAVVMRHCASALNLRKVIDSPAAGSSPAASMAHSSASYCYTKSGESSTVSIWSGGFKVGESSEADAKASGIPPCGG